MLLLWTSAMAGSGVLVLGGQLSPPPAEPVLHIFNNSERFRAVWSQSSVDVPNPEFKMPAMS